MSLSLLLAIEQQTRPELDFATLKAELAANGNLVQAIRRAPGHFEGSEAPILQTVSPVSVTMNIDGVDMKYDAEIVIDGYFPQGLCLGINELRCYNIGNQGSLGEARIDDKANLVMTFTQPLCPRNKSIPHGPIMRKPQAHLKCSLISRTTLASSPFLQRRKGCSLL